MTMSGGVSCTAVTPVVFWAVSATIALIPWHPAAAKAFRSAWIPAPPPESEPAIVKQRGTRISLPSPALPGSGSTGMISAPDGAPRYGEASIGVMGAARYDGLAEWYTEFRPSLPPDELDALRRL